MEKGIEFEVEEGLGVGKGGFSVGKRRRIKGEEMGKG